MENYPWTRLAGAVAPPEAKAPVDAAHVATLPPFEVRLAVDDGNFGGVYQRDDEVMAGIWQVAVAETRELIETW